ncbi:hypothetical protein RMSM_02245 [Rhodopirellula maiorica SM1]|uniref:Uncharacterized protein n=1 Tax=Rhodopirellula maiorica SM1 TaxID=1265738 RepID=M5S3T2_9BACT|nr:hypothetical protein RMSM_02245 [Rhodopirellula maiorica SM1]
MPVSSGGAIRSKRYHFDGEDFQEDATRISLIFIAITIHPGR